MIRPCILAMTCVLGVSGCVHLPNSAAPSGTAEQTFGSLTAATPIVTIIRERHIRDLDPDSKALDIEATDSPQ